MGAKGIGFENLETWKRARELTAKIYQVTASGEFSRDFGLRDQVRRSAVSIMSNIAEGWDRASQADRLRFLTYAKASSSELRSQLYVALDCGHIATEYFEELKSDSVEIARMISGLQRSLAR